MTSSSSPLVECSKPGSGTAWHIVESLFRLHSIECARLLDTGTPPALWFWRTVSGDEVDLLVETGPERFIALECKTAQQVTADSLKGIRGAAGEYGSNAIVRARIVCRTETAYPRDPSVEEPLSTESNQKWVRIRHSG